MKEASVTDADRRARKASATDDMPDALLELREAFNVDSDAAAIRRALGLARLIAREAKDDHTIMIERRDGTRVRLVLNA
jgi:hypothetical protein